MDIGNGFFRAFNIRQYPARFVSNGHAFLTLWQTEAGATDFNRRTNVGLHHFALNVPSKGELTNLYNAAVEHPGVTADFAPALLGDAGAMHAMLFEPGGIRIELIWAGN